MIDISKALDCIGAMKKCGTYRNQKIGVLRQAFSGMVANYSLGDVVLYREELTPSDAELRMGEYAGKEQRPTGRVTVEIPFSQEQIAQQRKRDSLISTIGTIIGVSSRYVEEVRV